MCLIEILFAQIVMVLAPRLGEEVRLILELWDDICRVSNPNRQAVVEFQFCQLGSLGMLLCFLLLIRIVRAPCEPCCLVLVGGD